MYAFSLTQSTYRRKPRNAVTQYSARTLEEKSKDDIKRATTDIISFIEKVTPRYAKSQPIMSQYISLSLYFVCQCCLHQLIHVTLNVLLCSCWAFWVLFEYCPVSWLLYALIWSKSWITSPTHMKKKTCILQQFYKDSTCLK